MKWVSIIATIALVVACFFPWVIIDTSIGGIQRRIIVSGIESGNTSFGKPGYFHFVLSFFFLVFHFTPRIWAKRSNLLVGALNIGWATRNYFFISACAAGECPEKQVGLYIVLISSIVMLAGALFPSMELKEKK